MTNHFQGKIAIKILLRDKISKKILITRDSKDEVFEIPGGRLDENENVLSAITREIYEELGVKLKVTKPSFVYSEQFTHMRENAKHFHLSFVIDLDKSQIKKLKHSDEVIEMHWVDKKTYKKFKYYSNIENTLKSYFSVK